jgi:hypothetical protein
MLNALKTFAIKEKPNKKKYLAKKDSFGMIPIFVSLCTLLFVCLFICLFLRLFVCFFLYSRLFFGFCMHFVGLLKKEQSMQTRTEVTNYS